MDPKTLATALKNKASQPEMEDAPEGESELKQKLMEKVEAVCSSTGKERTAAIEDLKATLDETEESPEEEKKETPEEEAGEEEAPSKAPPAKGNKMPWHQGYGN